MKKYLLIAVSTLFLTGCAPTRVPSGIERALYTVETNYVNSVLPQVLTNGTVVAVTNQVPVYRLVPSPATSAALQGVGMGAGSLFGLGGVLSALLTGVYSLYAAVRNRKVTAALVQGTETILEVVRAAPNGGVLRDKAVSYLVKQQQSAGVLEAIAAAVKAVDTRSAREAAQEVRSGN